MAILRGANGRILGRLGKDMITTLSSMELKITIETSLITVDVLNLGSGTYRPYHRSNERLTDFNTALAAHSSYPEVWRRVSAKGPRICPLFKKFSR